MSLSVLFRMYNGHGSILNISRLLMHNVHRNVFHGENIFRNIYGSKWKHGIQISSMKNSSRISTYGRCEMSHEEKEEEKKETCDKPKQSRIHPVIWAVERLAALGFLVLLPLDIYDPSEHIETVMVVLTVMHNHFGLEAIAADYIRVNVFGTVINKIGHFSVYVLSALILAGLLQLIINGDGLANTIKLFWSLQ